jgi:hypothetical protein
VWHFVSRCGLTGYAQVISTYIWSDEARKEMGSHFKLRKVETTRTPRVDHVMRSLSHSSTRKENIDKELAQIQTFANSLASLENYERLSADEIKDTSLAAAELIINANA